VAESIHENHTNETFIHKRDHPERWAKGMGGLRILERIKILSIAEALMRARLT
jgi:hypothetical protein